MLEYYNNEEVTKENINDGWMKTGDLVTMDEEGYVVVTGRIKDVIIRGGENISPKEIEECVLGLDWVENVQVIGVPCVKMGEVICALLIVKEGCKYNK